MIVILTPLALENAALAGALQALKVDASQYVLAVGGHGKVQFALSTQLLIQKHSPGLVICAGASGALAPHIQVLDVVIGEATIEHDFNLRFISRPLPHFPADSKTLDTLKRRLDPRGFKVHYGPLASGDEDILDSTRALEIQKKTQALAVAWEGAGGARACRLHGIPFIEIRAVTDSADAAATENFSKNLKPAMVHLANVIQELL